MIREVLKIRIDNGLGDKDPSFHNIELTEYQYKGTRMGVPELTATLMWSECLDNEWSTKEYVVLRGERFYIRHTPSSEKNNTDARYKHTISFTSEYADILGHAHFVDAVPSHSATYDKPCTNNTKFTFYGTIFEFADRMNCAFLYAGVGDSILKTKTSLNVNDVIVGDGFCVIVDDSGINEPDKTYEFSFENQTLWDALIEGYNKTEIPFERRGRKIIFGSVPNVINHTFKYGHDNELLSISKNNANAQVINRITMLGSSENIPYFYPNETEYGHITLSAKDGNKVLTADMIRIENAPRLISRLNIGQYAILRKTEPKKSEVLPPTEIRTSFDGDSFDVYTYSSELRHETSGESRIAPWHIRIYFTVPESDVVECSSVVGYTWSQNKPTPTGVEMLGSIIPESLIFMDEAIHDDKLRQVERVGNNLSLGRLDRGRWMFQFSLNIQNRDSLDRAIFTWCCLINVVIQRQQPVIPENAKYQWEINGERYDGAGEIGVVISSDITDDMVGDGFGWTADGRMPFQTQLMPPKYRETLGAERFYNALNDTYTDPDTGKKYIFPNPYIEGSPSEHIFTDETIKPTIEGIRNDILTETDKNGNKIGQLFGVIADIAYDDNDNDAAKADSEDSDKNDSLKYEHSYFYIKLNIFSGTYGFNLLKHYSQTDAMTLQMRSGSCNGCKFKVQVEKFKDETGLEMYRNPVQTTGENGTIVSGGYADKVKADSAQEWQQNTQTHSIWICVQKDAETFGMIMPNRTGNFMPKIGDKFNIINIDLPKEYNLAAEKKLEDKGIRYMFDNNEEKFTFDINASRIFFAENPDVFSQLDEYSKIKIEYNGRIYEQYVNEISIDCKSNEPLPNIGIALADTLAVGQNFTESVAERAASLIANSITLGGSDGSGIGGNNISEKLADDRYINKTKADRTPFRLSSTTGFEVGEFVSGGSGGIFYQDPVTGKTWIEADMLKIRMKAIFEELMIAKISTIRGENLITPGGSIEITFVEEMEEAYRCYFKAKDEDKGADCQFVVGDQVISKEFNVSAGMTSEATNNYYWRLVTAVDNNGAYIDLSKTDCGTDSGEPRAGDTIGQLGNHNDPMRQSAIILSTVDAFAPCVTLYSGIDSYSLVGKSVVEYGVDKTKNPPEPFFHCYGSFFFGPRDKKSYLQFEPSAESLVFKGRLEVTSTIGDKPIDEYIKEVVPPVTQEDIEEYVNAIVDPKIEGIQNQIDGVVETWFYNGVPTLTNYPVSEWNTEALKIQHLGDLYYDNDTGTAYRFSQKEDKSYFWNVITDDAITKALAAAQRAQDTADGKRRVFTSQPVPPYDKGDLWVNATYGEQYSNDLLRCVTAKAKGATFAISDWMLASKYTDDTALNQFISDYEKDIGDIQGQIDGKAQTWYQASDPSSSWADAEQKAAHKGDLWYCTADIAGTSFKKGTTWYWNGEAWQKQDIPQSVFDAIDGKADIFVSKPASYKQNDLWFLESDYTLSGVAYKAGTLVVAKNDRGTEWSADDWVKKDRYTDDTLAQSAINKINTFDYIKKALKDRTTIDGGLVLSSLIKLGVNNADYTTQTTYSGISGIFDTSKPGDGIAAFYGGDMIDKAEYYTFNHSTHKWEFKDGVSADSVVGLRIASTLFRMDGTGYLANGTIRWNNDGSGSVADGKLWWDNDGNVQIGADVLISGGTGNPQTMAALFNAVNRFNSMFERVETEDGTWYIKAKSHLVSVGEITAYGDGDSGSGGSGGASYLRDLLDVTLNNLSNGQALVWDGTKWVNKTISGGLDETALSNYLTTNRYATQEWVGGRGYITSSALSTYVTLNTKQSLSAVKYFKGGTGIHMTRDTSNAETFTFKSSDGSSLLGYIGYHNVAGNMCISAKGDNTEWWTDAVGKYQLRLGNTGAFTWNGYNIWHSGNDGSGSGLDADLLDGVNNGDLTAKYWNCNGNNTATINTKNGLYYWGNTADGNGGYPYAYGVMLQISNLNTNQNISSPGSQWVSQLASATNNRLYYRQAVNYNQFPAWKTIAFTSDLTWGNVTGKPTNFVTTDTEQEISGAKSFTASVTNISKQLCINGVTGAGLGDRPHIMLHIPNVAYSKFVLSDLGVVHLLYGGATDFNSYASLTVGSIARFGGTASQVLMADGSVKTAHVLSAITNLGWAGTRGQIATIDTIAFWNGCHSGTQSNLAYCKFGAFGDIVTQSLSGLDSRYVNVGGDTMSGTLTLNGYPTLVMNTSAGNWCYQRMNNGSTFWDLATKNADNGLEIRYHGEDYIRWRFMPDGRLLNANGNLYWHSGNDGAGSGLDADLLDGYQMSWLYRQTVIDASGLDQSTWYPVTIQLSATHTYRIEVWVGLNSGTKPSWSTHNNGFSVGKVWTTNGSGWGTIPVVRRVLVSTSSFANSDPVRGIGQLGNSSTECFYVRGGGKYFVRTDRTTTPYLRTGTYTINDQSVAPTATAPAGIAAGTGVTSDFCIGNAVSASKLQTARTLWGQSFNGTRDVSGDLWGVGNINFSNDRQIAVGNRYCFGAGGQKAAVGVNVGSLLVSNAWADESMVPANGAYIKGNVKSGGDFLAAGEITALSDRRAKTNINTLPCRGALTPRTYIKDGRESIGFVAQEVQSLYPELVRVGSDGLLRLNYDGITAVLQAQVNDHESRLQKIESMMNPNFK